MANTVEVLSGYDTQVYLATEQLKTVNSTLTGVSSVSIGNVDNSRQLPKITITANGTLTFDSISDGTNVVNFTLANLALGDTLVLDFENQEYSLNGSSIIDSLSFTNSLIEIAEDTTTSLTIGAVGDYDITVEYMGYGSEDTVAYLETFSISYKQNYQNKRDYKTNKIINSKLIQTDCSLSISKLNVSDKYLFDVLDGKNFRIKFNEQNPLSLENVTHVLLGVNFENYKGGFNKIDDLIVTDVNGFAKELIFK